MKSSLKPCIKSSLKLIPRFISSSPARFIGRQLGRQLEYLSIRRDVCPEVWAIETLSTLTALWWTLLLLATPRVFATTHLFAGMAERGQEREWGRFTLLLSLLGLRAIAGASALLRLVTALLGLLVWTFITLNLAQVAPWVQPECQIARWTLRLPFSLPESTGVGVYGLLAGFCVWAMYQLFPMVINDCNTSLEKRRERQKERRRASREQAQNHTLSHTQNHTQNHSRKG